MRAHVLKYGTYFYDDSIDEESDNVQWIAGLDMPLYLKSPYWKIIHAVRCLFFVKGEFGKKYFNFANCFYHHQLYKFVRKCKVLGSVNL